MLEEDFGRLEFAAALCSPDLLTSELGSVIVRSFNDAVDPRHEPGQGVSCVGDDGHLDRVAQTHVCRLDVDLDERLRELDPPRPRHHGIEVRPERQHDVRLTQQVRDRLLVWRIAHHQWMPGMGEASLRAVGQEDGGTEPFSELDSIVACRDTAGAHP